MRQRGETNAKKDFDYMGGGGQKKRGYAGSISKSSVCLTDLKVISSSVETCTFYYEFYINEHKHISLMWRQMLLLLE